MKIKLTLLVAFGLCGAVFSGCTNSEGRIRPPDPLGRALFDALDPGPRNADRQYVQDPYSVDYNQRPGPDYVWVDGGYATDANGRSVWVPAHWAQARVR